MDIEVRPATAALVDDVAAVLGGGACWCQYWRMTSAEYGRHTSGEMPTAVRARQNRTVRRLGESPAPGMLAYADGEPVGWCGIGLRMEFGRLERSRTIPKVDDVRVWSLVCFSVRTGHRRKGVARALLSGAIDYARASGAPALEAYPVDSGGERLDATFTYVGTMSMFEAAGFVRVAATGSTTAGRPRYVMRLPLSV